MKKRNVILIIAFSIIGIIAIATLVSMLYVKKCDNLECFNSALAKCSRASYIYETPDASWSYKITSKDSENCIINVKLLQLKKGNVDLTVLEGNSMKCYLPLSVVASPVQNMNKCHGLLKEELQTMIINSNHNYVLDNLLKIEQAFAGNKAK